jgi:hypothetical protein
VRMPPVTSVHRTGCGAITRARGPSGEPREVLRPVRARDARASWGITAHRRVRQKLSGSR